MHTVEFVVEVGFVDGVVKYASSGFMNYGDALHIANIFAAKPTVVSVSIKRIEEEEK